MFAQLSVFTYMFICKDFVQHIIVNIVTFLAYRMWNIQSQEIQNWKISMKT